MPDGEAEASRLLWRVSNYITLDGAGGLRASARWHTVGRRIVYLAESPAGAVVEALVHLEVEPVAPPRHYRLLKVAVPPGMAIAAWESAVPGVSLDDLDTTREAGDRWLTRGTTALLRVPSAILPETYNVLLNPAHPDARLIQVAAHERYPWHPRWGATPAPLARDVARHFSLGRSRWSLEGGLRLAAAGARSSRGASKLHQDDDRT